VRLFVITLTVEIEADYVAIYLPNGAEIVRWVDDEWLEDPSLTITIANAVKLAYTDPEYVIKVGFPNILAEMEDDDYELSGV
jgi:hypothetical protein